jgi:hypothetical protein
MRPKRLRDAVNEFVKHNPMTEIELFEFEHKLQAKTFSLEDLIFMTDATLEAFARKLLGSKFQSGGRNFGQSLKMAGNLQKLNALEMFVREIMMGVLHAAKETEGEKDDTEAR